MCYFLSDEPNSVTRQSARHIAAIDAIRLASSQGLGPARFGEVVLRAIAPVVPNDGAHIWLVDPATRLLSRLIASTEADSSHRFIWLRDHYLTELDDLIPYFSTRKMMFAGTSGFAVTSDQHGLLGVPPAIRSIVDPREHRQHFVEGGSPVGGFAHVPLISGAAVIGLLTLIYRGYAPFLTEHQFRFLTSQRAMIGAALATAVAREDAAAGSSASGIVVLGQGGVLQFATPAGEQWLAALAAAEPGGGPLPTSILAAVASLRSGASDGTAATIATRIGPDQLRVEASHADAEGGIAIVVNPIAEAGAPDIPEDWPLTQGERRVAEQVMLGRSNRQIAEALFVSESTVETHLRHIFDKMDIRRRTELVGLIFRASMLSSGGD